MHLMKHQIRVPTKIARLWCQSVVIPTSLGYGLGSKGLAPRNVDWHKHCEKNEEGTMIRVIVRLVIDGSINIAFARKQ